MKLIGLIALFLPCLGSQDARPWKRIGKGTLSGIEDGKAGWKHFRDADQWNAFRKKHFRVIGKKKGATTTEPLPDFDFGSRELVLLWGGTTQRTIEALSLKDGVLEARETLPDYDENSVARMIQTGPYVLLSLPPTKGKLRVTWKKPKQLDWKKISTGLLGRIEDKKRGWAYFPDQKSYEDFRKKHKQLEIITKSKIKYPPLPKFKIGERHLIIVWAGTMPRGIKILEVRPGVVVAEEKMPEYNEDHVARIYNVGRYLLISVPKLDGKPKIVWKK